MQSFTLLLPPIATVHVHDALALSLWPPRRKLQYVMRHDRFVNPSSFLDLVKQLEC
jgi:hypothetical protein